MSKNKPYSQTREDGHKQTVIRSYGGDGKNYRTDVWHKDSAGSTHKETHRTIIGGKTYDHYGKKI